MPWQWPTQAVRLWGSGCSRVGIVGYVIAGRARGETNTHGWKSSEIALLLAVQGRKSDAGKCLA
jgi:hypothetical protein